MDWRIELSEGPLTAWKTIVLHFSAGRAAAKKLARPNGGRRRGKAVTIASDRFAR